jgi:NAD(P)H-dependent flavin oxidoreductase YrpB (nitropropane dioxygenase family)
MQSALRERITLMHTELCDRLGIEFPIFAFSHCRDVVAAVSKAGGFGVLGALGFAPRQLEIELGWIDSHIGDKPYGVDIVIPGKYQGMGETDPKKLEQQLLAAVPARHRAFADKVLESQGVPKLPEGDRPPNQLLGWTEATATPQLDVALGHSKVKLIAMRWALHHRKWSSGFIGRAGWWLRCAAQRSTRCRTRRPA